LGVVEGFVMSPPWRVFFAFPAFLATVLLPWPRVAGAVAEAPDVALVEREAQLKAQVEAKIQKDILDPILGQGRAMVFVDVELEQVVQKEEQARQGVGVAQSYKERGGLGGVSGGTGDYILPGVPQPKFLSRIRGVGGGAPPEQAQQQQTAQAREMTEQRLSVRTIIKKFLITIIHDQTVPKEKLDLVRQRILDAFGSKYEVSPDRILFRPTKFVSTWLDDFKNPKVYVPLTFAGLLLLLLLYLFGPFSWLLSGLVRALREKGATEVTVDSRFEGGPQGQQGALGLVPLEGEGELGLARKKEEEEEEMKKFEPFSYITEENLKRLAYLLRHEEPWVAAVVLEYLKPEFTHKILAALPLELQAKVAIETATIRQLGREQVMAIDEQIKEKVNFVLGGAGHLIQMIEDSDEATRQNLLEYLKNEKPDVYEKVRKAVLLFEDCPNFPDRDVQTIIRSLKTEGMARALVGAHPDIVNKFLSNMSTGAAALLKEEMEYTHDLTPAQVEEERRKIMQVIKSLEREGKIRVREPLDEFALEGLEAVPPGAGRMSLPGGTGPLPGGTGPLPGGTGPLPGGRSPVPPAGTPQGAQRTDPAGARAALEEAGSRLQAGRLEECLFQASRALALDPDAWQAYALMGYAAYGLGRTQEALEYYQLYYERNPDPGLRQWLDALKAAVGKS